MKTKLLFGVMAFAMVLVSCKKDNDVISTMEQTGDANMRGMYVGWQIDSVNMQTTLAQYVLDKEAYTGKYYEVQTGNKKLYATTEVGLTWVDKGFAEDGLSFKLEITKGDQTYPMTWVHNALYDEKNQAYTSSLLDIYSTFNTAYETFTQLNGKWYYKDSTVFNDTIKTEQKYLKFDEVVSKNISWDSVQTLINYVASIQDTLHWYNEEFGKTVRDTVYYKETKTQGVYNAIAAQGTEASRILSTYDYIGNATEHFVTVQFGYEIADKPQPCAYSAWTAVYDTNYYKHPESAKYEITQVELENGVWTFSGMTNGKKFTILGKGTVKTHTEKDGVKKDDEQANGFQEFVISAYSAKDTTITLGEDKMKYMKPVMK
ncbi:MAG: hypothetical protein MJZ84_05065 [Paludibacteraceae bacterium]|nr:hypothetical protein [Paludibacteraceae bacterium]